MNKYKYFFISVLSVIAFTGCYDLDRYPTDKLSAGTFWQTEQHADQAMMGVYAQMRNVHVFGRQFSFDCLGGISMGYDDASYRVFQVANYDASNGTISNKFSNLYEGVARANIVLQNVDNIDATEEVIRRYKGEARFMRALYYFTLMDFFGAVPVYDEEVVVAESFAEMLYPRSPVEDVRAFILADLDEAIAALPAEWNSANNGRATSGAATALKGKVLLYAKDYDGAAKCFEKIVESSLYELYPDYENLFKPTGHSSSEMIFVIQCLGGVGQDIGIPTTFYMGSRSTFGSCWNNVMPATDFVDSYEMKDGRKFNWDDYFSGFNTSDKVKTEVFLATLTDDDTEVASYPASRQQLLDIYEQRDPRMATSVILPYTMYKGWVSNAPIECEFVIAPKTLEGNGFIRNNAGIYSYLWRKFVAEYDMDGLINNREHTPINFPLIRYADVLLMLAECYNELDKPDDAVKCINQVRARPGIDMPAINSGPAWLEARTKAQIFERIKHERAVELAAEGHSFSDMRRWNLLETLNDKQEKEMHGTLYYTRKVNTRDYLWPIPLAEIDKNPNLLPNNPGW